MKETILNSDSVIINTIIAVATSFYLYIGIREEALIALTLLLIIDFVTGLIASYKVGEPITSKVLKIGVLTKFGTILLILTIALLIKIMGVKYEEFLYGGIIMLALGEAYSIFANYHCMKTGERLKEFTVTSLIAEKIKKFIEGFMNVGGK